MTNQRNQPKGYRHTLNIKEVKYCLIKRREIKKGEKSLPPIGKDQELEYNKLRNFIAKQTTNVNIRKDCKRIFPILLATAAFIVNYCPVYSKRLFSPEEVKKNSLELYDKFK